MSVAATNYAIRHCKLNDATARHVLTVLAWASRPETPDKVYMTNADIREATGIRSANGVKHALRRLIAAGEIAVIEIGGRTAGTLGVATNFDLPGVRRHIESDAALGADGRYQSVTAKVSNGDGRYQSVTPNCHHLIPIEEEYLKDVSKNADSEPAPVAPLPSPRADETISPPPKKRIRSKKAPHPILRPDLDDQGWFRYLGTLPQFAHVDIGAEYGRCRVWCRNKNIGAPSRRRFQNWLERVEKPLSEPRVAVVQRNAADDYYAELEKRVGGLKA